MRLVGLRSSSTLPRPPTDRTGSKPDSDFPLPTQATSQVEHAQARQQQMVGVAAKAALGWLEKERLVKYNRPDGGGKGWCAPHRLVLC